jgi:uncharacterized membrane protein HdeD (DUF308 family)
MGQPDRRERRPKVSARRSVLDGRGDIMVTDAGAARGRGARSTALAGVLLLLGAVWTLFALAIPQFGLTTLRSAMVLLGILLLASAVSELPPAMSAARRWSWTHGALAVLFVVGGIVALAWTTPTFEAVARLTAWYLLVKGLYDVVNAFVSRRGEFSAEGDRDLDAQAGRASETHRSAAGLWGVSPWWSPLAVGAFEIGIAFWAVSYPRFSLSLLVLWVALAALATGLTKISMAFRIPSVRGTAAEYDQTPAATGYGASAVREAGRTTREKDRLVGGRTEKH